MDKVFIVTCCDGVVSVHDERRDAEKLIEDQTAWDIENIGESQEYKIVELLKYVNYMAISGSNGGPQGIY